MNINDQVISVEQAQKLKSLGVCQEGYFHWYLGHTGANVERLYTGRADLHGQSVSAFTVAELGVMCRDCISGPVTNAPLLSAGFYATPDEYANYDLDSTIPEDDSPGPGPVPWYVTGRTQAEALAGLLIWLLENNLITAEEVNARLKQ